MAHLSNYWCILVLTIIALTRIGYRANKNSTEISENEVDLVNPSEQAKEKIISACFLFYKELTSAEISETITTIKNLVEHINKYEDAIAAIAHFILFFRRDLEPTHISEIIALIHELVEIINQCKEAGTLPPVDPLSLHASRELGVIPALTNELIYLVTNSHQAASIFSLYFKMIIFAQKIYPFQVYTIIGQMKALCKYIEGSEYAESVVDGVSKMKNDPRINTIYNVTYELDEIIDQLSALPSSESFHHDG